MAQFSFDVVSEYDKAEMNNVLAQTQREISNRFDFKGTPAAIDWLDNDKSGFKITGNSDYQVDAILDVVRKKLASREQNQKVLDVSKPPYTTNLQTYRDIPFKRGLTQENAKALTKVLRDDLPKVKAQIQGEEIRIMSGSKDDLQAAMQLLKAQDLDFPLMFTNYR